MNNNLNYWYKKNENDVRKMMHDIWLNPELGFHEFKSAKIAYEYISKQGFDTVELHNAMDYENKDAESNSVVAKWGHGNPVIGFIGELDALPGLGQNAVPFQSPIEGAGHGCGHNTMAGCAAAAACALKYAMEKEHLNGTVVLVEAPAEEIGQGKSALARAGVFDGWDLALMWHPGYGDLDFSPAPMMVMYTVDFEFFGVSSHAAGPLLPESRSALDAAQLMNIGMEFMREHTYRDTWMHYCIKETGSAANVVPDYTKTEYIFRAIEDEPKVRDLVERSINAAKGAALMTGTRMEYQVISHIPQFWHTLPLNRMLYQASKEVPALEYSSEDYALASELYKNVHNKEVDIPQSVLLPSGVAAYQDEKIERPGGTDCADVSYFCPTIHCRGLARVPGSDGHNWKVTFISGTALGEKAAIYASKILAQGAYNALKDPSIIEECWDYYKGLNVPDYSSLSI